ncbi:fungal specific transcription factor domain-containing [Trichoderma arundinaceum]|uniref:Fungal specific transcription factor domain-containing n=1 Tax=Trichoderma arundinaceum TaxID=490622 RepID=A0A395N9N8_TRIAR|nr:fungal specific transcription factor domain-containing [Trichoderma arundinaceum]
MNGYHLAQPSLGEALQAQAPAPDSNATVRLESRFRPRNTGSGSGATAALAIGWAKRVPEWGTPSDNLGDATLQLLPQLVDEAPSLRFPHPAASFELELKLEFAAARLVCFFAFVLLLLLLLLLPAGGLRLVGLTRRFDGGSGVCEPHLTTTTPDSTAATRRDWKPAAATEGIVRGGAALRSPRQNYLPKHFSTSDATSPSPSLPLARALPRSYAATSSFPRLCFQSTSLAPAPAPARLSALLADQEIPRRGGIFNLAPAQRPRPPLFDISSVMNAPHRPPAQPVALPPQRPQVGIERLPARNLTTEPRESMNCKSCRKRKVNAVPKKRGPKTDVLEALLKRVDGLEAKLKEKNAEGEHPSSSSVSASQELAAAEPSIKRQPVERDIAAEPVAKRRATEDKTTPNVTELSIYSPQTSTAGDPATPSIQTDALLDTYFTRFHNKPFHIVDESLIRKRIQLNQLPPFLFDAIAAVAARHTPHPSGFRAAVKLGDEYAARARSAIDIDEPSIDNLQAIVLLAIAYTASGKGRKAFMLITNAIGMIMALELHREVDQQAQVTPMERETRRQLFWSCYLLDRFSASGSKRPSLIGDDSIALRLPSWSPAVSGLPVDGDFFLCGSNLQYFQGSGKKSQGTSGMLIDITRILGVTNRYLAAGGVKGDSHFPWHSLSNLSKIRQDLDVWASGTDGIFASMEVLFGQPDSTVLVLCKLIYHLIHCLIYRPFLPISLAELAGNGQHQSWQIEATNMCFFHANAITELAEVGRQMQTIEWPSFVGYCICTAGTVHIHGAHYGKQGTSGEVNVFSSSSDFLSREMQFLSDLRFTWAIVQHQRDMLQRLYEAHRELVKTLTGNAMRYTPGFQLEDFFDRYSNIGGPGGPTFHFDTANLSLADEMVDYSNEPTPLPDIQSPWPTENRPNLKRKATSQSSHQSIPLPLTPTMTVTSYPRQSIPMQSGLMPAPSTPGVGAMAEMLPAHMDAQRQQHHMSAMRSTVDVTSAAHPAMAGYGLPHPAHAGAGGMASMAGMTFNPAFNYNLGPSQAAGGVPQQQVINDASGGFDAMFGTIPASAYGSPATWQPGVGQATPGATAPSPSTKSNTGSTGTTGGDEKDPFMSLLEQLANDEQRQNSGLKSELDFFLAGTGATS